MVRYYYSLVENTYVVRQSRSKDGAEYLTPEGEWVDYRDLWDVTMNGRSVASEEEALETAKKIFEEDPEWWAWQGRMRAGDEAHRRGDYGEAEKAWNAGLEFETDMGVTRSLDSLARLYHEQGRYADAEPLYGRALAIEEKSLGQDHPALAERLEIHANLLQKMERGDEAVALATRAKAVRQPSSPPRHESWLKRSRTWLRSRTK